MKQTDPKMKLLLLLLNIALVRSIEVKLAGKISFEGTFIQGQFKNKGREIQALTDENQGVFDITDEALKSAIRTYHGRTPDHIYLTAESPYGDLYKKYEWSPVQVFIEGGTPILTHISTDNAVLTRKMYKNSHPKMETIRILESHTTKDQVTSLWDLKGKNMSADNVDIAFDFKIDNVDDVVRLNYIFPFSNKSIAIKKTRFQAAFIDLAPGDEVLAQLEAKKATLKFKIPYTATLTGLVAAHYTEKYQGHYFYGLPIDRLLVAAHKRPVITVDQWLIYEFYYGVELNILSADGHKVLQSVAADATTSGRRKASVATYAAKNGKKIMSNPEKMPFELSEEELKAIETEVPDQQLDEESEESTERTAEEQNKEQSYTENSVIPSSEVPKTE